MKSRISPPNYETFGPRALRFGKRDASGQMVDKQLGGKSPFLKLTRTFWTVPPNARAYGPERM